MSDYVKIDSGYGPLVKGEVYKVIQWGYDWVMVSAGGLGVYVPKTTVSRTYDNGPPPKKPAREERRQDGGYAKHRDHEKPRRRDGKDQRKTQRYVQD